MVRSCFRVAELSDGFDGELANDQNTFMVLEGAMISIGTLTLTTFHPGLAFIEAWRTANFTLRKSKGKAQKDENQSKQVEHSP